MSPASGDDDVLSIGGYRANHELLASTIFSNPTNRNKMVDRTGGYTVHHPSGEVLSMFEASNRYQVVGESSVVIGGKDYGCGSSRIMAVTGPLLLGVRVVIAESIAPIHRSNLWQSGIVPLLFPEGTSAKTLGLDGSEEWFIPLSQIRPEGGTITCSYSRAGEVSLIELVVAMESPQEFQFFRQGGAMAMQMRDLAAAI